MIVTGVMSGDIIFTGVMSGNIIVTGVYGLARECTLHNKRPHSEVEIDVF
jgi:hypothetical protein